MRMTRYTDYAIRSLLFAGAHADRLVRIQEVADCYDISKNHLMKVVYRLGQNGLIHSVRGRGGGFRLASPPDEIYIGDVVQLFEPTAHFLDPQEGIDEHPSLDPARKAFDDAIGAFHQVLNSYTIQDLLQPSNELHPQILEMIPTRD
ncbi:Rrf2 family transcriptional regulator [Exiguobacterium sp. s193]|uniref:RrF2 family transcriptional regulator n=1 Tax=Exiguobacterium sp. s193 TaxID=2751207 RepID=UPI001BECF90D|nr:Rrf2 family transcriptional regulator [Exiguobacterium sp. s193]